MVVFNIPLTSGSSPILATGDTFLLYTTALSQANIVCGMTYASGGWVTSGTPSAGQSYNPVPTVDASTGPITFALPTAFGAYLSNGPQSTPTAAYVRTLVANASNWAYAQAGQSCFTPYDSPVRARCRCWPVACFPHLDLCGAARAFRANAVARYHG